MATDRTSIISERMPEALLGLRGLMSLAILFLHQIELKVGDSIYFLSAATDVFFVVSGFSLSFVYGKNLPFTRPVMARYTANRLARFIPLAWITVSIFFLIQIAIDLYGFQRGHPLDTSLHNYVGNLLFLDSNIPGFSSTPSKWFLSNILVAYIFIFPLTYFLANTRKINIIAIIGIAIFQIFLWENLALMNHGLFQRCIPGFLAGCLLYYCHFRIKALPSLLLFVISIPAIVIIPKNYQLIPILCLVLASNTDKGIIARIFSIKPLHFLADIGFSLFLTHQIFTILALAIITKIPEASSYYFYWIWILMSAAIFTAYITQKYFEKPFTKKIKSLLPSPQITNH